MRWFITALIVSEVHSDHTDWTCDRPGLNNRVKTILSSLKMQTPPEQDNERLTYLAKLMAQRQELHHRGIKEEGENIQDLVSSLCTS
jgi:hypothetical protein